jgi:hypothetical protein
MMCLILPIKCAELPWICSDFRTVNGYLTAYGIYSHFSISMGAHNVFYNEGQVYKDKTKPWTSPRRFLIRSPSLHQLNYKYPVCLSEELFYGNVKSCTRWGKRSVQWPLFNGPNTITLTTSPKEVIVNGESSAATHTFSYYCHQVYKRDLAIPNDFIEEFPDVTVEEISEWYPYLDYGCMRNCHS